MTTKDFSTSITVDQTPREAFNAVGNVRGWWSENIEGGTRKLNDVFDYHYEDVHRCKIKLIEVVPDQKIVWHILDNYFKFTKDETEWKDTKVIFEITEQNGKTQVCMTHMGLVPEYECYDICRDSWTSYIQKSLRSLIETGVGKPNGKNKPTTENERKLTTGRNS